MVLKRVLFVAVFATTLLMGSIVCFAQSAPIGGRVFKVDEEGKQIPVEGVKIVCYRTDIQSSCRTVTTDKRGEFVILGVPFGGKVILGVSGEGLSPTFVGETPVGSKDSDRLGIQVTDGDGREATEEEVRAAAAQTSTGDLTDDQKKAQEDLEKQRAEIAGRNSKVEERNKLREEYIKDGVAAYNEKNYDVAIEKFKAGYELDPEFVGSAPTFLNNMAAALKGRAVMVYVAAAKTKNSGEIAKGRQQVSKDFTAGLDASLKAHNIASNAKPAEILKPEDNKNNIQRSLAMIKEIFNVLGQLKMTITESVATTEDAETAVKLYKSTLNVMPDDPDVLAGLTISLYYSSTFSGDATQKKESLTYSDQFFSNAKKDHGLYPAVQDIVNLIKSEDG